MTLFCGRNDEGFQLGPTHSPWSRDFLVLDFFGFLCCPSGFSTVFYYLLVLYRAVTQNVQPARTFLLYTYMTCGLLARERARRRASARAERAIKKNWREAVLRFFATTFQMGQTRRVLSGVKNPELEITATRRQSEKTSFLTFSKYPPYKKKKIKDYRTF